MTSVFNKLQFTKCFLTKVFNGWQILIIFWSAVAVRGTRQPLGIRWIVILYWQYLSYEQNYNWKLWSPILWKVVYCYLVLAIPFIRTRLQNHIELVLWWGGLQNTRGGRRRIRTLDFSILKFCLVRSKYTWCSITVGIVKTFLINLLQLDIILW